MSGRVLVTGGAGFIGSHVAEAYLSVNWEATGADIGLLIHAHPTLSELFGESALALTGRSLHA